ncbi:hypothetical protein HMI54_010863, partial [Coelomomyces lativittatus]
TMKEPPPKLPSLIIPVTDPQTLTSTTLVPSLVPSSLSTLAPTSPFFPTHASSSSSSSTSTTSTTTIPLSSVGSSKPTTYVSGYDPRPWCRNPCFVDRCFSTYLIQP